MKNEKHQDAVRYLSEYGWLPSQIRIEDEESESIIRASVRAFQQTSRIPITGKLDELTMATMKRRRCGNPDSFTIDAKPWPKAILTYRFENFSTDLPHEEQRRSIRDAFDRWSAVVPLIFREVNTGDVDMRLLFAEGEHGDETVFDGVGGILAHAFYNSDGYPDSDSKGDIHFDEGDEWNERLLLEVALHEIGHAAIGLGHSTDDNSVMNEVITGYVDLKTDDRAGAKDNYQDHIWIASLYRDVLGRSFDEEGLDGWVRYRFGGGTLNGIAKGFTYSPENSTTIATELYSTLLDREPDEQGLAGWRDVLSSGLSRQQAIIGFVTSIEYRSRYLEVPAFVESLYLRLLNRAPDTGGFTGWVVAMQEGMPDEIVARGFLNSEEYCRNFTQGLYEKYLRREPDVDGWTFHTNRLKAGRSHQRLVADFLTSNEYRNKSVAWW